LRQILLKVAVELQSLKGESIPKLKSPRRVCGGTDGVMSVLKAAQAPQPTMPLISRKSLIPQSAYSRPLPDCL